MFTLARTTAATLAAATLIATLAANPAPAEARGRGDAVAGLLGGFAIGAIVGSVLAPPPPVYYYGPPPPPPPRRWAPRYYGPEPVCYTVERQVWVEGWGWRPSPVTICE